MYSVTLLAIFSTQERLSSDGDQLTSPIGKQELIVASHKSSVVLLDALHEEVELPRQNLNKIIIVLSSTVLEPIAEPSISI